MTQWYVRDLSKLTHVSVQTLHYYDRINLLKPSVRLVNGYRVYSEKDLLKLQQIIALKFFGFELSQIKTLLAGTLDVVEHFSVQSQCLEEKAKTLLEASKTLKSLISDCGRDKSIPWETIIKLIEVYRMTQQLEKTWAGKVLTPEEIKEYAAFEAGLKTRFTENEKETFEQNWAKLIGDISANLDKDPTSEFGITLGKRCMDMVNGLYGKEYAGLKHSIWNKGFKTGKMDGEHFVAPEVIAWLDKAIDTYYRGRIYSLLDQVSTKVSPQVTQQWKDLMTEMYGDSEALKQDLIDAALVDDRVSLAARAWLQQKS
jgi:DNA-binding transcriptional MerR regulator